MEKTTQHIDSLFSEAGDYIEAKVELWKLKTVDTMSEVVSSATSKVAILVLGFFFFILFNIGIALWLGELLGKIYYGFFLTGGFYALACLIIYLSRDAWLKTPVSNMLIRKILK